MHTHKVEAYKLITFWQITRSLVRRLHRFLLQTNKHKWSLSDCAPGSWKPQAAVRRREGEPLSGHQSIITGLTHTEDDRRVCTCGQLSSWLLIWRWWKRGTHLEISTDAKKGCKLYTKKSDNLWQVRSDEQRNPLTKNTYILFNGTEV